MGPVDDEGVVSILALHIASYALRIGVLSWSCKALDFYIAIHFNASVTFLLRT